MTKDSRKAETLSHLRQISKHLWNGQVHGRAAVMIGCGFSRNAQSVNPSCVQFPLWSNLAEALFQDLHPDLDRRNEGDPIRLASQFEVRFGRTALHRRLQELIPDLKYNPGQLHIQLLNLPWSDVFTVNYDTLLERTLQHLEPERQYTVIRNQGGIAGSSQPRLVKLHGSFPDHLPLVITEEDYRCYPSVSAPFVNMVQQSMMENTFVLLGFSGDDPNFLRWSGWVRDNLKSTAPRIYLCGMFNEMDESQKELLQRRNIAVVDLVAMIETDGSVEATHDSAIAAMFSYLEKGKPKSFTEWPFEDERVKSSSARIPEATPEADLRTLQKGQEEYPGWIVCPARNREQIWDRSLKPRVDRMSENAPLAGTDLAFRLAYLDQLVWRLERCLYPLFDPLPAVIQSAVNEYFAAVAAGGDADQENALSQSTDKHECTRYVCRLLLALARDAREDANQEEYERYCALLAKLKSGDAESLLSLHYEKCLGAWNRLDFDALEDLLKAWPKESGAPFWETKHASLLLVVGQYHDAWRILEDTLSQIRSRLHDDPENIWLLSQEAWTMLLLYGRDRWTTCDSGSGEVRRQYHGRWHELAQYMCNPFAEIEAIGHATDVAILPAMSEKPSFDLGKRSISHHLGSDRRGLRALRHRAMLRFHEETALQIRMGPYANIKEYLPRILPPLFQENVNAAIRLIARYSSKEASEYLTRIRVSAVPSDQVQVLFDWLSRACGAAVNRLAAQLFSITEPSPWDTVVSNIVELISRLAIRLSSTELSKALDLAGGLYRHPLIRSKYPIHESVGNLFKRTLESMSMDDMALHLQSLLELPLGTAEGSIVVLAENWPEPFRFLEDRDDMRECQGVKPDFTPDGRISFFIQQLRYRKSGRDGNRWRALVRLVVLSDMGILSVSQKESLASALWECLGEDELPDTDGYYLPAAILRLPERTKGEGAEGLRRWLLKADIADIGGKFRAHGPKRYPPEFLTPELDMRVRTWNIATRSKWRAFRGNEYHRQLEWSAAEASETVRSAIDLWKNQKGELGYWQKRPQPFFPGTDELRRFFLDLSKVITKTLTPYLDERASDLAASIEESLLDMLAHEVPVQRNLHMLLWLNECKVDLVSNHVQSGMHSKDYLVSAHSIAGVCDWVFMAAHMNKPNLSVPEHVRRSMIALSLTRNTSAYRTLLDVNATLVSEFKEFYSADDKALLCDALEAFLDHCIIPSDSDDLSPELSSTEEFDPLVQGSRLAAILAADYESRDLTPPRTLQRWQDLAVNMPLPEMKKAWALRSMVSSRR